MQENTAYFCSGGGTTAENVIKRALDDQLGDINPRVVIASKPGIGALKKAEDLGIPTRLLKDPYNSQEILRLLDEYNIKIASLNGWMPQIPADVIIKFTKEGGLMFNQHPGPVREDELDFGGKGMYGSRVTAARVLYLLTTGANERDIFTESTIQYLHPKLDRGNPVGVRTLNFEEELTEFRENFGGSGTKHLDGLNYSGEDETIEALRNLVKEVQDKLLPLEHDNMAEVLHTLGKGGDLKTNLRYYENLVPAKFEAILNQSKHRAIQMFPKG